MTKLTAHKGYVFMPNHKLHAVTVNHRTFFIWYPKGVRPYVTDDMLVELFKIQPGHCISVGV